jgi:adenylate cyclase
MSSTDQRKRLVAILSADAVGYSRLMTADEAATVAALDVARAVFRMQIESNHGRVIDMAGDSVLAVFDTATGAVSAALAIQQELEHPVAAAPEDCRMRFRIGVHLGDVIEKADGTVYGDGVNIAARLEGLAEPGGITVSDSIRNAVKGKVGASFEDQGQKMVKNLAEPVSTYRIVLDVNASNVADAKMKVMPAVPLANKPSIAVLPFDNMSNDQEQEYFSDGITEDIITELSKLSGLFVIARHSTFTYKGKSVTLSRVGRELGVRYVLEGSVRKAGNRLRITAQLTDAITDHHVWADRYDRNLEDVFAVQDEVARSVAATLAVALTSDEHERLGRPPTHNIAAYDLYLRSRTTPWPPTRENILAARKAYQRITEMDPTFVGGHAGAALACALFVVFGHSDQPAADAETAIRTAEKALAINDRFALGQSALGLAYLASGRRDEGVPAARKAIELQPSDSDAHAFLALTFISTGKGEEAGQAAASALRLDPQYTKGPYLNILGVAKFVAGAYEEAIGAFRRNLEQGGPIGVPALAALTASCAVTGRAEEARESAQELLRFFPGFSVTRSRALFIFDTEARERLGAGLRKAGVPE